MAKTPIYKLTSPELGDDADGTGNIQTLAQEVEDVLKTGEIQSYTPTWTATGTVKPSGLSAAVGRYVIDRGICTVGIWLSFASNVNGGRGDLRVTLPIPGRVTLPEQYLISKVYIPGVGSYLGQGMIVNGDPSWLRIVVPQDSGTSQIRYWRSADATGAVGTGYPAVSGKVSVLSGGNLAVSGTYFI